MNRYRLISILLCLIMTFSAFAVTASADNADVESYSQGTVVIDNIVIDENTDLSALGLEDSVVFVDDDNGVTTDNTDLTDSANTAGSSVYTGSLDFATNIDDSLYPPVDDDPSMFNNITEFSAKAEKGSDVFASTVDFNSGVGITTSAVNQDGVSITTKDTTTTQSVPNATVNATTTLGGTAANTIYIYECTDSDDEFDITANRTWTINGSVQFNSKVVIRSGCTLTIKYGTPTASTSYNSPVVRIISGLVEADRTSDYDTPNNSKALFSLQQGAGLKIYGIGGTSTTYDYGMATSFNGDRLVITGSEKPDTPIIFCSGGSSTAKTTLEFIGVDIRNADNQYDGTDFPTGGQGGAISINCNMQKAVFRSCLFYDCKAGDGGAVAFRVYEQTNEAVVFDRCVFNKCTATRLGGAIFTMSTGTDSIAPKFYGLNITNCKFVNCTATSGGAFYTSHITESSGTSGAQFTNGITVTGTTFSGCKATDGHGGAVFFRPYKCTTFTVTGCTFSSCTATRDGGGITLAAYSGTTYTKVTINSNFTGCTAGEYGGAISDNSGRYSDGVYLDGSTFTNCQATGTYNADSEGGAVFVRALLCSNYSFVGCTFNSCTSAKCGGAVSFSPANSLVYETINFTNSTFTGCKTGKDGGAIAFKEASGKSISVSSQLTFSGCSFSACELTKTYEEDSSKGGAAVYLSGKYKNIVYNGGSITGCIGGEGVGFMIDGNNTEDYISKFTVTGVSFTNNIFQAGRYGGVIKTEGGTAIVMELNNCVFSGNTNKNTSSGNGGAIYWNAGKTSTGTYAVTESKLIVVNCEMYNNTVENGSGAGIYNEATIEITNSKFYNNTASKYGGGIVIQNYSNASGYLPPDLSLTLDSTTEFYDNSANNGGAISFICRDTAMDDQAAAYGNNIPFALKLNGSQIYSNTAVNAGGGIHFYSSAVEDAYFDFSIQLNSGDIYGNTAVYGGGIYATSAKMPIEVNISGGVIGGDGESRPNEAQLGGGIYLNTAYVTLNMTDGSITHNIAYWLEGTAPKGNGGGIYTYQSTVNYSGGSVSYNSAGGNGGGVYAYDCTVTFTGGSIDSNSTQYGGGIYANNAVVNMNQGDDGESIYVSNNTATNSGGGMFLTLTATVTVNNGSINDNTASIFGGGVRVYKGSTFTLNGGSVYNNSAFNGGGIYVETAENGVLSQFKTTGGSIYGNKATDSDQTTSLGDGAGVYIASQSKFDMTGGYIYSNVADGNGGGIYAVTGNGDGNYNIVISGGVIGQDSEGNEAPNEATNGGGVAIIDGGYVQFTNGLLINNKASNNGGGVYASFVSPATQNGAPAIEISGGDISANIAGNCGGGIYADTYTDDSTATTYKASVSVTGGNIGGSEENGNTANYGGGVYIDGALFTLDKTDTTTGSISYNLAIVDGGGGYFYSTTVEIKGNITNNTAQGNGGGIYLYASDVDVAGDISDNKSISLQQLRATVGNGGGAYLVNGSALTMDEGGNITGNTTDGNGGGIAAYGDSVVNLGGGIITRNVAGYGFGGGVYANDSQVEITGSDICYNSAKNGGGVCVTLGGNLVMLGGLLRYNTAVGMPDSTVETAYHLDETLSGVGGGVYLSNGVEAELSTYELTGTDNKFGIYGNLADFAADDVFANGVNTQLTLPRALSMTLTGTEFERATGWFEDYANDDTRYADGLNGNPAIGGERYKSAERTVVAYVNEDDAADKATETTVYINTANTYVCLTLGVAKAGYGEITITKTGDNIDPDQIFVFTISGVVADTKQPIEFSVTITGTGSITITDVPDGEYTITEDIQWSWRYTLANITVSNGSIDLANCSGTVTVGASDASPDIEFFNNLENNSWLDGNSPAVKNVAGTANETPVVANSYPITVDLPRKEELV